MPRPLDITTEQRALAEQCPGYASWCSALQSCLRRALKDHDIHNLESIRLLNEERMVTKLNQNNLVNPIHRRGLRLMMRWRHQLLRVDEPEWINKMATNCRLRLINLSIEQLHMMDAMGWPEATKIGRKYIERASLIFARLGAAEVKELTAEGLIKVLVEQRRFHSRDVHATNVMMRRFGRVDITIRIGDVLAMDPTRLTQREAAWISGDKSRQEWFLQVKGEVFGLEDVPLHIRRRMMQLVRALNPANYKDFTSSSATTIRACIAQAIVASQKEKNSLSRRGFGTRGTDKEQNALGRGLMNMYRLAAIELCRYLHIPVNDELMLSFKARKLWKMVQPLLPQPDADDTFIDAVTGADATLAIQNTTTAEESLIMSLAIRLGMRVGAITQLRLHGLLHPFERGSEPWRVRESISGVDKGRNMNEWHLFVAPGLQKQLEDYINKTWRPLYEQWHVVDGRARLVVSFLFPGKSCNTTKVNLPVHLDTMRRRIKSVLQRVGVEQPRSHPHACRKGFATELLRHGNDPQVVATLMHHRQPTTTIGFYDKRSNAERLANVKVPVRWDMSGCNAPTPGNGSLGEQKSSMESDTTDTAAMALASEMESNSMMRLQLSILAGLLSPEQAAQFAAQCEQQGIPPAPPVPTEV